MQRIITRKAPETGGHEKNEVYFEDLRCISVAGYFRMLGGGLWPCARKQNGLTCWGGSFYYE